MVQLQNDVPKKKEENCASICHKDEHESGKGVAHVVSIIAESIWYGALKVFQWLFEIAVAHNGHAQPVNTYILCTFVSNKFNITCIKCIAYIRNSMLACLLARIHIHIYAAQRFPFGTRLFLCDKNRYRKRAIEKMATIYNFWSKRRIEYGKSSCKKIYRPKLLLFVRV